MKKNTAQTGRHFTLVELMIAMAVLVIMMGFLFQFIISAQRLWSASNNNDILFEQAQLCFDLLEKDLKAAIVQDEETNPGRALSYELIAAKFDGNSDPSKPLLLCLVTQVDSNLPVNDTTGSAAFPVIYYVIPDTGQKFCRLYRRVIDEVISSKYPLECFGMTAADFKDWSESIATVMPGETQYLLCDNVVSIQIFRNPTIKTDFVLPEVVKITLELMEPSAALKASQISNDNPEATTRIFTKTIFLH